MTLTTLIDKNTSLTPIKTDDAGRLRLSADHKIALLDSSPDLASFLQPADSSQMRPSDT
ncbi:DUF2946 family protein [Rubritalea profundi]|uniref:DUF2946 family protein n=1 Tax=Rubritalea profundi TaxID=1658618 RepID=UPI0013FE3BEA|nr:DUF2946 family protein [Rubritalea profundi]